MRKVNWIGIAIGVLILVIDYIAFKTLIANIDPLPSNPLHSHSGGNTYYSLKALFFIALAGITILYYSIFGKSVPSIVKGYMQYRKEYWKAKGYKGDKKLPIKDSDLVGGIFWGILGFVIVLVISALMFAYLNHQDPMTFYTNLFSCHNDCR